MGPQGLVHHGERVGSEHVLAGDRASSTRSPARRPQRRRRTAGIARQARAGTMIIPRGSRRAVTTPGDAVRVSRSPSRQPRAQLTTWSVTRPDASMRPVPYTTSAGTDRAAAGPAMGSGRTEAGLTRGVPARRPGEGMTGAIGWAVTAASRNRAQHQPVGGGRPTCSSGPPACSSGVRFGNFSPVLVSEGGLEPPRRCCITDSVMYHHSKLTRKGPAGAAFRRRKEAAAPARRPVHARDLRKRQGRSAGMGP